MMVPRMNCIISVYTTLLDRNTKAPSAGLAQLFFDAFFELADLWTIGISAEEYADFLMRLFDCIAEGEPPVSCTTVGRCSESSYIGQS